MALAEISFFAKSLGMMSTMNVLIPEGAGPAPLPVFYLLHGLSDDHTAWVRRTNLERYVGAAGVPMIVVMPAGGRGWYCNSATPPGLAYEDFVVRDVVGFVDRFFPTVAGREGRVIGGLSMGGYGAVKLALKFPEMFCSATAHSAPLMTPLHKPETRPDKYQPQFEEFQAIFGKGWRGGGNDPVHLARICPEGMRPAVRIDCGVGDFLIDQNREFHAELEGLGFGHEYAEFAGEHIWAYWDLHVQEALAFHARILAKNSIT